MRVIATQKGYYGNIVREAGDAFVLADEAAFTDVWMRKAGADERRDPLDHDGDGRKGGSKPKRVSAETTLAEPAAPAPAVDAVTGDEI
jgi:hypothetical protein